MDIDRLIRRFRDVPPEYRPIPFWSWNDRLDPEELRVQIRSMHDAGIGGFIMHARGGLETEYLGDEWMECIRSCLDESRRLGMRPWIYDENGWPSGYADGRVPARDTVFYGRWLILESGWSDTPDTSDALAHFEVFEDGTWARLSDGSAASDPARVRTIRIRETPYYVDVMNPDATDVFIAETHERYRHRFPGAFGNGTGEPGVLAGFFTDEPRFSGSIDRDPPWSPLLPEAFRRRFGYDIADRVLALFLPVEGHEAVRYDFYSLCSDLFVASFTGRLGQWCRESGVALTGHIMMEESVFVQAANTSGVMAHYTHMDIPGVDWLRRPIGTPVVPKQAGSAAAQLGRKQVLTESFALAGWDVNFEELKRIVEWQYVNGVNLLCQHLQAYSLRGFRKRDYPPSLFYQQPWWKEYKVFNDYISRLGMILAEGTHASRILVIHPMRSGWLLYDGTEYRDDFRKMDRDFVDLCETLSGEHLEYHLGDETIIADHGAVVRRNGEPVFRVGKCDYEVVVIPSMVGLASSTLDLLEAFSRDGGAAWVVGRTPRLLDGRPSDRLDALFQGIAASDSPMDVADRIRRAVGGFISIRDLDAGGEASSIHCTEREIDGQTVHFLVNLSQENHCRTSVELNSVGSVWLYDAVNGKAEQVHGDADGQTFRMRLDFAPMQSRMLVAGPDSQDPLLAEPSTAGQTVDLSGTWNVISMGPNALTLDCCRYRIDGGPMQPELPVIHLMARLLELQRPCDIELEFSFESDVDGSDSGDLRLAIEALEEYEIAVNGRILNTENGGWWRDRSFRTVDIRESVRIGRNVVSMKRRFHQRRKVYDVLFGDGVYETEKNSLTYDVELESIYIIGDFHVHSGSAFVPGARHSLHTEGPFRIVPAIDRIEAGELTARGLPFYSGEITLSRVLEVPDGPESNWTVSLDGSRAVLAAVSVNGCRVALLPWAPRRVDLGPHLHEGTNELSVTLWSGNRNLLGPHHHTSGETYSVGPGSFTGDWSWAEKETEARPATAEERSRSYWREGYSFVTFGLGERQDK